MFLSGLFWCLLRGNVYINGRWWDNGEKGLEKEISALGVEVHRQWSIELCGWDAEGYNGNRDGRTGNLGGRVGDGAEGRKVGTMGSKDDVVGRVECDLVATVRGGLVGLGRVDCEHVGGHLGRDIVDHDGEFLRESWRRWKRSWLDACKDLVHSEEEVRICREVEEVIGLLRSEGSKALMDVFDWSLGEFWINSSEGFAANLLVIGAGKMPRELDGGLLDNWRGYWLDVLHLDVLDGNREGFEAEAKGLG